MSLLSRLTLGLKISRQLGLARAGNYALYRLQLSSGYLYRQTRDSSRFIRYPDNCFRLSPLLKLPNRDSLRTLLGKAGCRALLAEADEVLEGRVRLFGGDPVPLDLGNENPQAHWTELEKSGHASAERDIKWAWEAGRFGWAVSLARAYWLSSDEKYPAAFWKSLEAFLEANPTYEGAQWTSGQEVALRMISLLFCTQVFSGSPHSTPERMTRLGWAIAAHAGRIPAGMAYARAQNNNHRLSEAAGLYTAGLALREHPSAGDWRKLGWQEFHRGIASQIAGDGSYTQNSTNYHRLMLQLALWMVSTSPEPFPEKSMRRLAAAACWLLDLLDVESGRVPNLGPNDGAYILPLSTGPVWDFRPVVQAAVRSFLGRVLLPAGKWDEMGLWLAGINIPQNVRGCSGNHVTTIRQKNSWAYLRAVRFSSRPGHADQLHVDLWWQGTNVALDAGTYLYNADPPWDNSLSRSCVHNTITVNGEDQMSWAGRFQWLDWAQARLLGHEKAPDGAWERLSAEQDGYRKLGIVHQRSLTGYRDGRWLVEDRLQAQKGQENDREFSIRLHWLLPDWPYSLQQTNRGAELHIESSSGQVKLLVSTGKGSPIVKPPEVLLTRGGEILYGNEPAQVTSGWYSPTYACKVPALSLSLTVKTTLPVALVSEWYLPEAEG